MSVKSKKFLSIVVYWTLAVLSILSAVFFIYCVSVKSVPIWARVVYYIWTGLVIGFVIYDMVCTSTGEGKYIAGWICYILSILAVVMAVILYLINAGRTGLMADFFNLFLSVAIISLMTTGFIIATWCVGENLNEHASAEDEIENREQNKKYHA